MVCFLISYAEQNALLLPGRIPEYSRSDIKLLLCPKGKVYHSAAENADVHAVAYTTFWRKPLPSVIIMKPMTDLCWTCQQNSAAIRQAANSSEATKSNTIREAEEHLRIVQVERSFYKSTSDACRESVKSIIILIWHHYEF